MKKINIQHLKAAPKDWRVLPPLRASSERLVRFCESIEVETIVMRKSRFKADTIFVHIPSLLAHLDKVGALLSGVLPNTAPGGCTSVRREYGSTD